MPFGSMTILRVLRASPKLSVLSEDVRILFLSSDDSGGGAAIASTQLFTALREQDVTALFMVQRKNSEIPGIQCLYKFFPKVQARIRSELDRILLKRYPHRKNVGFTSNWLPQSLDSTIKEFRPDIIHLHFLGGGILRLEDLALARIPLVWTLHDMWALTGGCHYSGTCTAYANHCGTCPILGSKMKDDLSAWNFNRKLRAYSMSNLHLVTPSQWLAKEVRKSFLLRDTPVEVIPNSVNLDCFRPKDRNQVRAKLGLPLDKCITLFSAIESAGSQRKGIAHFENALLSLDLDTQSRLEIAVVGTARISSEVSARFKVHSYGFIKDQNHMADLYSACDFISVPSIQDNLPNIVLEGMGSGIPSVAFRIGGLPDLIEHEESGLLVDVIDSEKLSTEMSRLIQNPDLCKIFGEHARKRSEVYFSARTIASKYIGLYKKILA